ncbi:SdpA family antimicrobial peptide system protein [Streptomyces sp. NPDC060198]|uniref:SdpA family antimicrobial peptide system protein n=1 Tax=Streptomyces sp. NPDC060198 TaxID=3347070 RepID=UPI003656AD16
MKPTDRIPLTVRPATVRIRVPRAWTRYLVAGWVVLALYVAQAALPPNAVRLPMQEEAKPVLTAVAPQGWAFFTKSARDTEYAPFAFDRNGWHHAALAPHAKASNAFGFDRASRSQGIEVALLTRSPGTRWVECGNARRAEACLAAVPTGVHTTNASPEPTLCGRVAVVQLEPVPWAWRDLQSGTHTALRAAVWEVECR